MRLNHDDYFPFVWGQVKTPLPRPPLPTALGLGTPFAVEVSLDTLLKWVWRVRLWSVTVTVNPSNIGFETLRKYALNRPHAGAAPFGGECLNEKIAMCARDGLKLPDSDGTNVFGDSEGSYIDGSVQIGFRQGSTAESVLDSLPRLGPLSDSEETASYWSAWHAKERALRIIYEDGEAWRPAFYFRFHVFRESLIDRIICSVPENDAPDWTAHSPGAFTFDGIALPFYLDSPAALPFTSFVIEPKRYHTFAKRDGTDPIYHEFTGELLPGKDPFAHQNPLE